MQRFRFSLRLVLEAPFLTQASGALGFGLDAVQRRDAAGAPVLPGSLIRGNLRHAWEGFAKAGPTAGPTKEQLLRWLGEPSPEASGDAPVRGVLRFDDLWRCEDCGGADGGLRYRVRIDPKTGAADDGALQVIDSPYPSGKAVSFQGGLDAWLADAAEAALLRHWLHRGLAAVPALGALKGAGFGRLLRVEVQQIPTAPLGGAPKAKAVQARPSFAQVPGGVRLGLALHPLAPFCFARHRLGNNEPFNEDAREARRGLDNRFLSEDFIPGGAIKGAIAGLLRRGGDPDPGKPPNHPAFPLLSQHLDAIRVTHALPAYLNHPKRDPKQGLKRDPVLPLSLAAYKGRGPKGEEDRFHDLARCLTPETPAGLLNGRAPLFAIDWKPSVSDAAREKFGLPDSPGRQVQVRTAIDAATRASKEHDLFSLETVVPDGYCWLADLAIPEIPGLEKELECLLSQGLFDLGKTKAAAAVELGSPWMAEPREWIRDKQVVIGLQSAARLLDLKVLQGQGIKAVNDGGRLFDAYKEAWGRLSDGLLELQGFFAQQGLVGGAYWYNRFRKVDDKSCYNPELHTLAGSVFVFGVAEKREKEAAALLRRWHHWGLPQLQDAPGGEDWRYNPYIRANGYGEVLINGAVHWQPLAAGDRWTPLAVATPSEAAQPPAGGFARSGGRNGG
jgi:hypothetical protein